MSAGQARWLAICTLLVLVTACTPRTVVRRNPGPHDQGIRYYLPKPYLFVAPYVARETLERPRRVVTGSAPSDQFVSVELQYLPDFSEQYALQVKTGLGTANVSIELEDGWRLTKVNQELDSQFDENVNAIANLLKSAAPTGVIQSDSAATQDIGQAKAVVRATNVPIGFYEAVLGRGPGGEKQIFGWRYLGFAPYASCPIATCGSASTECQQLNLYGLVFDNGVMTFKKLYAIEVQGHQGSYVRQREVKTSGQEREQHVNPSESVLRPSASRPHRSPKEPLKDNVVFMEPGPPVPGPCSV